MNTQTQSTVEFVVAQNTEFAYSTPIGPLQTPVQLAQENSYYVAKPNRLVCQHDSNDLGRAVTLIMQLLPLITENMQYAVTNHNVAMLTPTEVVQVTQLLLKAGYILETASVTPAHKCKVNFKPANPASAPAPVQASNPFTGYYTT